MGSIFAIFAALCNSTIGILSKLSFNNNENLSSLAFFRCLYAFLFVTIILAFKKGGFKEIYDLRKYAPKIFLTSFFGVFILYYFEIWALKNASIPIVSFLLYASGIIAIVIGILWLKESFNRYKFISILLVFLGVILIFITSLKGNFRGGYFAIIAGCGYSIFLVLTKKFKIPGTFATLFWLFAFGSFFLFFPFLIQGFKLPSIQNQPYIICLAFIPTIGGYYFTNKALSITEASSVQIFEMSEPIFASLWAFILFSELMSTNGIIGAILIFIGLYILQPQLTFFVIARKSIKSFIRICKCK